MPVIVPPISQDAENIGYALIGCGIAVHRLLGPGYKGLIYQRAFAVHRLQVRSYLKAAGLRLGYVMNFNQETFTAGCKRVVL